VHQEIDRMARQLMDDVADAGFELVPMECFGEWWQEAGA
jgi:hypothetical protein